MDELSHSQQQLGRAIEKARGGEDKELATHIRDMGEGFVRQLFGALRLTRIHTLDNNAYDKPVQVLEQTLKVLVELLGAVHMVVVEGQVYINDVRVRLDERGDTGEQLAAELRRNAIGGISFHAVPSGPQIRRLIELFAADPHPTAPRAFLQRALVDEGVDCVELVGVFRFRITGERAMGQAADVSRINERALDLVDTTLDALASERMPNPLPLRRVVTEILEVGPGSEGLWDETEGSTPFSRHTMRVSLFSMMMGREAGLSDEALQDLGVLAMFHDVGYAAREGAVAPSGDDPGHPGYPPPFERHGGAGARMVLRQRGFHEAKILRALATLEHHRDYNHPEATPSLFSRIIMIADTYETLTRKKGAGLTPPEALERLAAGAGTRFDPVLLQVFINAIGKYPPSSVLELDDGRIVRVVSAARAPETWAQPSCMVLFNKDGQVPGERQLVDLAEEGRVKRCIG